VRSIQAAGPGTADPRPAGDGPGARPDRGAGCPHSATCSPSPCHGIRHPRRWQRLSRGPVLRQADGGAATVGGLFSVPLSFRVLCDVRGVSELDKLWTLLTEAPSSSTGTGTAPARQRPAPHSAPAPAATPPRAPPKPSSPSVTPPPDQGKHQARRQSAARRPVEPAATRHDTPTPGMPEPSRYPP
jgi:hypothetical protein